MRGRASSVGRRRRWRSSSFHWRQDSGPAGEQVRTFILGEDPAVVAESLGRRIAALGVAAGRAPGRGGEAVGQRLAYIVEAIETLVLPVDSRRALELLVALIERDGDAMEGCGDHCDTVGSAMGRAAELVEQAIGGLPPQGVRPPCSVSLPPMTTVRGSRWRRWSGVWRRQGAKDERTESRLDHPALHQRVSQRVSGLARVL